MVDLEGLGLEIGPSFRPTVTKASGRRIMVADHANTADLRKKYEHLPGALERIEEVDYVITGRLADSIPERSHFDYIIASHVIEHYPDFVGFLKDCEVLLKPNGVLSLAVPDKRYCLDAARGISSLGEILRAHHQARTRPDEFDVLDFHLNTVSRGGECGWSAGCDQALALLYPGLEVAQMMARRSASEYVDVHIWRFTPGSFRLILGDLAALNVVGLSEIYFSETSGHEFFVSLSPAGGLAPQDRPALLQAVIEEGKAG